jgi:hypothetical protein
MPLIDALDPQIGLASLCAICAAGLIGVLVFCWLEVRPAAQQPQKASE